MKNFFSTIFILLLLCVFYFILVDKSFTPFERDFFFKMDNNEISLSNPQNSSEEIIYSNNEFNLFFFLSQKKLYQVSIRFKQELFLPVHLYLNERKVKNLGMGKVREGLFEALFTLKPTEIQSGLNHLQFFGTNLKPENIEFVSIQNFRGGNKKIPEIYILFEEEKTGWIEQVNVTDFFRIFILTIFVALALYMLLRASITISIIQAYEMIYSSFLPSLTILSLFSFSYFIIPYRIHFPELTFNVIAFYLLYLTLLINTFFQYREEVNLFLEKKVSWLLLFVFSVLLFLLLYFY